MINPQFCMENSKIVQSIGILGAGGQADELVSFLDTKSCRVSFYALSKEFVDVSNKQEIDIKNPSADQENTPVIAAVGAPLLRKELVLTWQGDKFTTVIANNVNIDKTVTVGSGSIIAPGVIATTGITIGKHSIINVATTIGHGSFLGNFSTLGPGVHLAGNVKLGDGVFVGIGAVIKNNIHIASGVVIGAGAVVIHDITEENAVYAGVPARKIGQNSDWLSEVR